MKGSTISQTVLLELTLKAGALDDAVDIIRETLAQTAAFEGNESLEVLIDDADPTKLVVVEKWRAAADHDAYLAWRATPEGATKLGSIVTGPPVTRSFDKSISLEA